jgi:hypothetical protein
MNKSDNKKKCLMCGELKKGKVDFYISRSRLYKCNDERMPICKTCLSKLYNELNSKYNNEIKSLYHLCMMFDIYFDLDLAEKSSFQGDYETKDNLLRCYMKNVNSLNQYKFKDSLSSDCVILDDRLLEIKNNEKENKTDDDLEYKIEITPKVRRRWGKGYTDEEYEDLEYFYREYKDNIDYENDYMKLEIIKEMCTIKLIRDSAKRSGDFKTARDYSDLLSKKMTDADLKPSQRRQYGEVAGETLGMDIREIIENYEPVNEPLEEFKDVDKLGMMIQKCFLKPFQKVFGLSSEEV